VEIIDTAAKRNKKKKSKAKEEEDPFTADTSSKKGSKKKDAKGGLPMGVVAAALVGVAGVAYYFSTVGGASSQ